LAQYTRKEEVREYIDNTLMKTYSLEVNNFRNRDGNISNNVYFVENSNEQNTKPRTHFIIAGEFTEAGEYYNESTYEMLKQKISSYKIQRTFDPVQELLEYLNKKIPNIFEDAVPEEAKELNKKIILNYKTSKLKKIYWDALGRIENSFQNYKYKILSYVDQEDNKKRIELNLEVPNIDIETVNVNTFVIGATRTISVMVMKRKTLAADHKVEKIDDTRDLDNIVCDIPLQNDKYPILEDRETMSLTLENGILKIIFMVRENSDQWKKLKIKTLK
jgi:hypothetical protein